jgi:phosphoadenosine phosphosulfate reductase
VRKVRPLNKVLAGASGWLTGLRRDQSAERAHVPFAVWDAEHQLVKLNPIADWSLDKLEAYIAENTVPVNPLHARGFPSIGCQPCTRAILPGEDIRAGRWWWENEDGKECGLHNRPKPKEAHAS